MITGAGGFIGSSLVNYFSTEKIKIYAYFNSKVQKNLKKNIVYVKQNLKNLKRIKDNVDTIIHCAARTPPFISQNKCYVDNLKIDKNPLGEYREK